MFDLSKYTGSPDFSLIYPVTCDTAQRMALAMDLYTRRQPVLCGGTAAYLAVFQSQPRIGPRPGAAAGLAAAHRQRAAHLPTLA